MSEHTTISVVICIYNGSGTLEAALRSVQDQDYPSTAYELILVNDGSKDDSEKICIDFLKSRKDGFPCITYISQKNEGLSSARNTGVYFASGDLIAFIDQDAVADPQWLKNMAAAFLDDKEIGVVGGRVKLLNNDPFPEFIFRTFYRTIDKNGDEILNVIGTNMAFRKEVFTSKKGFFNHIKTRGDEHSFINLKVLTSFRQKLSKEAVVYHKQPASLKDWIRERYFNGHECALVEYTRSKSGKRSLRMPIYSAFRTVCLLTPVSLVLAVFSRIPVIKVSSIILALPLFYKTYGRGFIPKLGRIIHRYYKTKPYLFFYSLLITGIGRFADEIGYWKGLVGYRKVKISDNISADNVEKTVKNHKFPFQVL